MPVFDLSRIIGLIKSILITIFVWKAFKALMLGLTTVLVPWALYKSFNTVGEKVLEFVNVYFDGSAYQSTVVEFTDLAAWIAQRLQLQTCFQILSTFIVMRFVLGFLHKG
ncbi:hypothetical protein [Desulfobacter vibrioformis]|uniref:hypothetical protein n=1 Tax=Desulfobacter vibrioformis TaxID=34031 RepID=UPI00054E4131|nr:hypothetical protein [Desulfobacter vibrioformis]